MKKNFVNLGCGNTFHPDWLNYDLNPQSELVTQIDLLKPLPFESNQIEVLYASHVLEHLPRSQAPIFLSQCATVLKKGGIVRIVVPDLEGIARKYVETLENASSGNEESLALHEWMTLELLDQLVRTRSGGFMGRLWFSRPLLAREFIVDRLGQEAGEWILKIERMIENGYKPIDPEMVYQIHDPDLSEELKFRHSGEIHRWMYDRISLERLLRSAGFSYVYLCNAYESSIEGFINYQLDTDSFGKIRKPDSLFMEAVK
jgi:predicted SAM-dependent methyltransferase